jgi:tape measure domain-containing protein
MKSLANAADASRGLEQYVQMMSTGAVDLQSFRTLQETMGVALNDVAKAFGFAGKSAQNDLYDALKSGEITMEQFNAKLIELNDGTDGFAERALTASGGIKTAWTNMQTAVVRGVTEIIEAIDSVLADTPLQSIENVINNIGSAFFNFLDGIAEKIPIAVGFVSQLFSVFKDGGLPAVFQLLTETAQGSIDSILDIITSNLPTLFENGRQMYLSLIQGIIDTIPQLLPVVTQIVNTLVNTIVSYFPKFLETGTQVLLKIVDGISQMLPDIVSAATDIIENLVVTLINNLPKIISTGVQLLLSLVDGISNALPRLVSASVNLITNISATLVANLPRIIAAGTQILISLNTGILKLIPRLLSTGVKIVGEFSRSIIGTVPKMVKAGADLIKGLWNGIKSVKDWILGKISGFVDGIVGGIKKFFGIASPSKVLRDEVGRWVPAGLIEGINRMENDVVKAAEQLTEWATPEVPEVALSYATPAGLHRTLSSAIRGTVDVTASSSEDKLVRAIDRLDQRLNGLKIQLDTGALVGETYNEYDRFGGNQVSLRERWY